MQAHFVGYLLYNCIYLSRVAFSSLFLGIRLATSEADQCAEPKESLSVPFSSGFALQRETSTGNAARSPVFQFPFPRDSPCNRVTGDGTKRGDYFQFPFPRDSPCNKNVRRVWWLEWWPFSSLFLGIRLATLQRNHVVRRERAPFQFPFPRDSPCNLWRLRNIRPDGVTFSSLFLGIRLATGIPMASEVPESTFSSLFLGIRLATSPGHPSPVREILLSVPFSSGFALQHSLYQIL